LARIHGETVVLTHPCHPRSGQEALVLQYDREAATPSLVVEFPDRTRQRIPLAWTDRTDPSLHQAGASPGARLSGPALLELVRFIQDWGEEA
jgi:hypothetical protein